MSPADVRPTAPRRWTTEAVALLGLGLPLIGSNMAQFAIGLTDTLMLGWYDVTALAASTLANSLYFVLFLMGAGFAWAVTPIVAAAVAARQEAQVRRVTRMGLWLAAIYGLAVTLPLMWSERLFLAIGQDPAVAALAQDYLRIAGWAMIPALMVTVLRAFLSALELTGMILWATVGAAVLNALLNYAFIFGNWGAPEMGIEGAAVASLGSTLLSLAVLGGYALVKRPEYRLLQRIWRFDAPAFVRVFRLGLPIGLTSLAESGLFSMTAVMVGWIGAVELAAHGIALNYASAAFMLHLGLSQAATVRAGQAMGRHDEAALRLSGRVSTVLSVTAGVLTVILFVSVPGTLVALFIDPSDPARGTLLTVGVALLAMAALFNLMDGAQVIALGLLRGVQDTTVPMIIAAISYWVVGMPVSFVLGFVFGLGAVGVWLGLVVGLGLAAILLMWRFWRRSVRIGRPGGRGHAYG
jgi:MATE family multidrug resistance protein